MDLRTESGFSDLPCTFARNLASAHGATSLGVKPGRVESNAGQESATRC